MEVLASHLLLLLNPSNNQWNIASFNLIFEYYFGESEVTALEPLSYSSKKTSCYSDSLFLFLPPFLYQINYVIMNSMQFLFSYNVVLEFFTCQMFSLKAWYNFVNKYFSSLGFFKSVLTNAFSCTVFYLL